MTKNKLLTLAGLSVFLLSSCADIFYSPDAIELANSHTTIAILPPSVSIPATKKTDGEALKEQQKTESLNFQKEMYSWMLKRKMQGRIRQEILDIETTNAKLRKAGYPETPYSPSEMCEILGVEGVMGSNYVLPRPMSEGTEIALILLGRSSAIINEVSISMNISDCSNKKLIWNYNHRAHGDVFSSPSALVNELMSKASRKMPYFK